MCVSSNLGATCNVISSLLLAKPARQRDPIRSGGQSLICRMFKEIVPLSGIPHESGIQERDFVAEFTPPKAGLLAMTGFLLFGQPHVLL